MDRRRPNRVPLLLVGGEAPGLKGERVGGKLPALLPPAGDGGTSRSGKPRGVGLPKLVLLRLVQVWKAVVVVGPEEVSPSGSLSSRSRSSFQGFIALEGRRFSRQPRYIGVCVFRGVRSSGVDGASREQCSRLDYNVQRAGSLIFLRRDYVVPVVKPSRLLRTFFA